MKRLLVVLSHPRLVLLLGTVFEVGTAAQLVWRDIGMHYPTSGVTQ